MVIYESNHYVVGEVINNHCVVSEAHQEGGQMGRKPRTIFTGALYHIIQRGNNKNFIYDDIMDKKMFFKILVETKTKYDFQILYYVLIDNHYHLLLEAGDIPISKSIQILNTAYSKYYNKKYNRTGTVYGGRYTASLVTDTRYYYQLLKYIANNPVKAGIVKNQSDYRWSAHISIKTGNRSIIAINRTLSYFPSPASKVLGEYVNLIENNAEISSDYGLVSNKEAQKLKDSLDYILQNMKLSESIQMGIKNGDKNVSFKNERDEFIKLAINAGFKTKEIASHISYSYEYVRRITNSGKITSNTL